MMNYFERQIPYLGFNDKWFLIIGLPLIGFLMPMLFFGETLRNGLSNYYGQWAEGTMYTIAYWSGVRMIMIQMHKYYPTFEDTIKRIIIQFVVVVLFVSTVSVVLGTLTESFFMKIRGLEEDLISGSVGTYAVVFLIMTIYETIYLYDQLKNSIKEKEAAKMAQLHSELEGLRNQVNPHFLFNSLNTLMNIVAEDQRLAISFLKKLSKVYRYVLESRSQQLISMREEMAFMESYIFLQKERFQSNLQIHIDVPPACLDHKIIPLALQILFENAIKHNVLSSKKPLKIQLFVRDEKLVVENNLQRKRNVLHSTRVGLENVRTRYKIFTDRRVEVYEDAAIFSVALPLLEPMASSKWPSEQVSMNSKKRI